MIDFKNKDDIKAFKYFIYISVFTVSILILFPLFIGIISKFRGNDVELIKDKKNQILFANKYQSDGWNGANIELLKDGSFKYTTTASSQSGTFKFVKDTIVFDKNYIGSYKALLRQDTNSYSKDTFIMIVNNKGFLKREGWYKIHPNTNKLNIPISIVRETEFEKNKN